MASANVSSTLLRALSHFDESERNEAKRLKDVYGRPRT